MGDNERRNDPITVTSPLLPPLDELIPYLEDIWKRKWITNNGYYHQELEKALCAYLKVPYISFFTNGTLPIMVALQALNITGEVITTPYSFVATTHSIWWNNNKPVFVDVEEDTGNIDPDKIEAAITSNTSAIMPVHVYGTPCNIEKISSIAGKYGLKVIYDAAHAFGVEKDGKSILNYGNLSTLSFHATKTYNTLEGGALVCYDEKMKQRIDYLKNFGFASETEVVMPGINGKVDEVRSAYGLLNLKYVNKAIERRRDISQKYRQALGGILGIRCMEDMPGVKSNYSYFPIFINEDKYGMSRDALYEKLKTRNIMGRRYFYPLISSFPMYQMLDSAASSNLPVATKLADSVICLPMHHGLIDDEINFIVSVLGEQ